LKSLRVGCVKYLNARPLIRGWKAGVDFDHPSALCNKLAAGKLDVALVSSFEFLRNPIYRIVDDVSISSDGPVYSVVVVHPGDINEIEEIELDPASATSANLLRCLLAKLRLTPAFSQGKAWNAIGESSKARLLIGDQAIRFRQKYVNGFSFWDLGQQWQKLIGLPFVYALWLIRPEVADPERIANELRALRDKNLANRDELIAEAVAEVADVGHPKQINPEFLVRYYREHLQFSFGEKQKEGMRIFANLCMEYDLLPKRDLVFHVV
jgi:chorismate dehydratase